jgi:hypothetical protein
VPKHHRTAPYGPEAAKARQTKPEPVIVWRPLTQPRQKPLRYVGGALRSLFLALDYGATNQAKGDQKCEA